MVARDDGSMSKYSMASSLAMEEKEEEQKVVNKSEDKPVPDALRSIIIQQKFGGNWTLDALVWKRKYQIIPRHRY